MRTSFVKMGADAITRLNTEGLRKSFEPLKIVDEAREALSVMPQGKMGLVLGSGSNTSEWRSRGWYTLDLDPESRADITGDANDLEVHVPTGILDFVYAECINFDPKAEQGVHSTRLLQQVNKALRNGGELIIRTAHGINVPGRVTVPDKETFAGRMVKHGFRTVVESHKFQSFPHPDGGEFSQQEVVYYGQKVADGYSSAERVEAIL